MPVCDRVHQRDIGENLWIIADWHTVEIVRIFCEKLFWFFMVALQESLQEWILRFLMNFWPYGNIYRTQHVQWLWKVNNEILVYCSSNSFWASTTKFLLSCSTVLYCSLKSFLCPHWCVTKFSWNGSCYEDLNHQSKKSLVHLSCRVIFHKIMIKLKIWECVQFEVTVYLFCLKQVCKLDKN